MQAYKNKRVVVTGGLGLIGSNVARQLVALDADVTLIDSLGTDFGGNLRNVADIADRVRINISDVRDTNGLQVLLRDCDYIFNLAGRTSHMDSMTAPFEDLEINCKAQLSLLEVCRAVCPGAVVVFASTRQIYGRPDYLPVDEKHKLNPVDVNGINKIAGEWYHLLYCHYHGLRTSVLRLTNVYGPGMRIKDAKQMFLGIWVRHLLEGRPFEVWGGTQRRDFLHVEDAATAFLHAGLTPGVFGQAYNVGGRPVVTLNELAEMLVSTDSGRSRYTVREYPAERRRIDIGDYFTNDEMFRQATTWTPKVELKDGLTQLVSYYRDNLQHYL